MKGIITESEIFKGSIPTYVGAKPKSKKWIFVLIALAFVAVGGYFWWKNNKKEDEEN